MNPNVLTKASESGAIPIACWSALGVFEWALRNYCFRYLSHPDLKRAEKLANLPFVEQNLATMLHNLREAKVADYNARAEIVATELSFRISQGKLDAEADSPTVHCSLATGNCVPK